MFGKSTFACGLSKRKQTYIKEEANVYVELTN